MSIEVFYGPYGQFIILYAEEFKAKLKCIFCFETLSFLMFTFCKNCAYI